MNIRGLERVIPAEAVEIGKFYLSFSHGGDPTLFQCVEAEGVTGQKSLLALIFSQNETPHFDFREISTYETLIEMPAVHLRIDPPSVSGTGVTTSLKMNTLIVVERQAIIAVAMRYGSWAAIDITTGRSLGRSLAREWASFSRWSLVVDEGGQEIEIAAFGAE